MSYVLLDRFPVLVARRTGPLGAESMAALRDEVNAIMRRSATKVAIVYDAQPSAPGSPDAAARKVVGEWLREDSGLLVRRCAGLELSLPAPVSRGVLTAILWVASPPMPCTVHGTTRAAIDAAIARVAPGGSLRTGEILKALDALSRS